ncbi:hypothetical protein DH86_00001290 [Scytalidium sp. 3C]|nr:hypothetical protein DH86_00001290 [Scytalidium sp. 3C]
MLGLRHQRTVPLAVP